MLLGAEHRQHFNRAQAAFGLPPPRSLGAEDGMDHVGEDGHEDGHGKANRAAGGAVHGRAAVAVTGVAANGREKKRGKCVR